MYHHTKRLLHLRIKSKVLHRYDKAQRSSACLTSDHETTFLCLFHPHLIPPIFHFFFYVILIPWNALFQHFSGNSDFTIKFHLHAQSLEMWVVFQWLYVPQLIRGKFVIMPLSFIIFPFLKVLIKICFFV